MRDYQDIKTKKKDYQDMRLLLRYAREEMQRAEAILDKGGQYSLEEFQGYINYAIESLRAVMLLSNKKKEKEK